MVDSAAGFGFGLAGTAGVEGLVAGVSCTGLNSRSRFGFGAGEMDREGGPEVVVAVAGGTSVGLLTLELGVVPIFSNRARKDDTGLSEEPSGPSPLVGSMMVKQSFLLKVRVEGDYTRYTHAQQSLMKASTGYELKDIQAWRRNESNEAAS